MVSRSQLKYIQSLGQKKYRDEEGVFVAEGPKLVKELIESHVELTQVYALNEWIEENKDLLKSVNVTAINETELERTSQLKTPNKVIAIVKKFEVNEPGIKEIFKGAYWGMLSNLKGMSNIKNYSSLIYIFKKIG
jgi:TrmH family RNA methyltransferase